MYANVLVLIRNSSSCCGIDLYSEKIKNTFRCTQGFTRKYKECVHTAKRVGVGEQPPHSPYQVHVRRHMMKCWEKKIVLKYIGRRIWVEGARTDCHAYQIATTVTAT